METASAGGAANSRRALFGKRELSRLINPASVAVIGASATAGSFGLRTLQNISVGYKGSVYPINPKYPTLQDYACYGSIGETPTVPDCAILTIPRAHVIPTLEECAKLGVGGAIVFSSGFAELGTEEGKRDQDYLTALARESGMRISGPNCMGMFNIGSRVGLSFMPGFFTMPIVDGPIGLVLQSGALGYVVLQAMERGIGFTHYLSPGNSCDVDVCDLINYLIEDDATKAIACSFEGVRDGERLIEACRRALAADKPLVVYKLGSSEISKRTALSHTGTLAGANAAYQAVFERTGAIVVNDFDALLETALFFAKSGKPAANGVGVMASSGGAAVMAADKAADYGVELPPPAQSTSDKLKRYIPSYGSAQNPSDITAESLKSPEMYGNCITSFVEDPCYGAVVVPMMSAYKPSTVERAKYLSDMAKGLSKPICLVWLNEWFQGPGSEVYDSSEKIAMFRSMGHCFSALKSWISHSGLRTELLRKNNPRLSDKTNAVAVRALLQASPHSGALTERESKNVLAAYGIRVTRESTVTSADQAAKAAAFIGYPVAMKAESADIPHKTEAGVVRLTLTSEAAVRCAYEEITASAAKLPGPPEINGVAVQEMVGRGIEVMIGLRQDPQFGTLVMCGLGGIFVELMKDVAVALAPVDMPRAHALIKSLKGYPLLAGFRGSAPVDVEALAEMLCRLSELGSDLASEIAELDVNPVIMREHGGVAVDALVMRQLPG